MKNRFLYFLLLLPTGVFAQFKEVPMNLTTSTGDLKGALIIPENAMSYPVVILLPGSGPTDRNGNSIAGVKANSYRLIAEGLAQQGIATLLIDKRGIGASKASLKTEAGLLFDDYVKDAVGWIQMLRKTKGIKAVFIAGHSEGSLIGMLAAEKTKVQGYISIAGPARSADEILVEQLGRMAPQLRSMADSLLKRLKNGEKLDSVPPNLYFLLRPSIQPYIKNWIHYTPCAELKKLKIPTLIIQGTTDIQVASHEAEQLAICQPKASLKVIEGMNHVLKTSVNDLKENKATYTNPVLPLSDHLIETISTFVQENN
jgi:uncharacterized protein